MIRRLGRSLAYGLLGLLLAVLLLALPLFLVLGSESGTRWVIGHALGFQQALTLQMVKGNMVDGLTLRDVHFRGRKFDLYIQQLVVRWSLASLLGGRLQVKDLELEQTRLVLHGPPTPGRVRLPLLPLPLPLDLDHGEMRTAGIERNGRYLGLDRLVLNHAHWALTTVTLPDASATAPIGRLALHGAIHLHGDYPLQATGTLELAEFDRQGLQTLQLQGGGDLGHLTLGVRSTGALTAAATGSIDTLSPQLPYQVHGDWQAFRSPWLPAQALSSKGGEISARGTRTLLQVDARASLAGTNVPAGDYALRGETDWHTATVHALEFRGLGGSASGEGRVDWTQGLAWQARLRLRQINPGRKWPVPPAAVPVLSGTVDSRGQIAARGSSVSLTADLAGGERWQADLRSDRRPWQQGARQQLAVRWAQVGRQVPALGALRSTAGQLTVSGTPEAYQLAGDFQLQSPRTPEGQWHVQADGRGRTLRIGQLAYDGSVGTASFSGVLDLGKHISWDGVLLASELQTGWLLPAWPGSFSGSLASAGEWSAGRRHISVERAHLTGSLRDKPISIDGAGAVELVPGRRLPAFTLNDLQLVWGEDQLHADGGLAERWAMRVDARLHDLGLIDSRLGGQVDAQLNLSGDPELPSGLLHLDGQAVTAGNLGTDHLVVDADIRRLGLDPGSLTVSGSGLSVGQTRLDQVSLALSGSRDSHDLHWQVSGAMGMVEGRLHGRYDSRAETWAGSAGEGRVHVADMDWLLAAPASLAFDVATRTLRAGPHCWTSGPARLCNDDELVAGPAGHARLHLSNLDAARLQPYLPNGMSLEGTVSGDAEADWQEGELPRATANLLTQNGTVVLSRDEDQAPLRLAYKLVTLQAFIQRDDWRLRFDLLSDDLGSGYIDTHVNPGDPAHPLTGQVTLQGLQLEVFRPFFPALSTLSGQVAASGQLGGVLKSPAFSGQVTLSNGRVVAREAPVNLSDVGLTADVQGDHLQLSGQASSGQGTARLSGEAAWGGQPHLNLALQGRDFEISQPPMVTAPVDPDLKLAVVPGQVNITGRVVVHNARINIKTLAENATPLSPDVVVINTDAENARSELAAAMKRWQVNADIDVVLGDLVAFHGFGVNALLSGDIRLQQQGNRGLQGTGDVELDKNARYDAYGQKLQITRGRIIFAGPLTQPGIDAEASKQVDNITVGIRVTGRANAPEVSFFSDSDLSQGDIVSYLLVGRPMYQNGQFSALGTGPSTAIGGTGAAAGTAGTPQAATAQQMALATAAIKLTSSSGGDSLASRIGGAIGVQDVAIGAEQTSEDTQFTVSGYVNPRLYLSYGVGVFTPVNTVKVRYNISSRLYLEAVSSLENAIDLYYNFKF